MGDGELDQVRAAGMPAHADGRTRHVHAGTSPIYPAAVLGRADAGGGEINLLQIWHFLLNWRWLLAGALVVGVAAGLAITLLTTPIYRASTTLQIDHEPAKIVAVESQEQPQAANSEEFYQTQYGLLKSRALAERIVTRLNLANDDRFLNQKASGPAPRPGATRTAAERAERTRRATAVLMEGLKIEPIRGSRLVRVSYESPNPVIAARIANAMADNFIASNLERRYEASSYARRFLEDRLNQIRQRLEDSERQLVAYAASNEIINVGSENSGGEGTGGGTQSLASTDLAAVNGALAAATSARIQAEQRWRQAEATSDQALPEVLANPSSQSLQGARATLWADYQKNLQLYKPDYPTMVEARAQIEALDRQLGIQARSIKDSLKNQYQVALRQERSLASAVEQRKGSVLDLRSRSIQYNIIQREVDTSRTLYDGLLQRYKEIGVAGGIGSNNISVVDRANTPTQAVKPQPLLNLGLFGFLGLALGALTAFAIEQFDVTMKAPPDVEKTLGLPLLGTIPVTMKGVSPAKALSDPRSPLSEAYYSVRTALQFSTQDGAPATLLVTSARPAEGKTTSALAIATGFARLGARVLLVDADLRAPSLHKVLARDNGIGLSNLLAGGPELAPALQPTNHKNLTFLPCGPPPPNPAELLGGEKMRGFLNAASAQFDLVVVDGPPVMGFADAPLLANLAAGAVLVVEAGATKRDEARQALNRLLVGDSHVLGVVLTKFDMRKAGYGYGHAHGYGYGGYAYEYGVTRKPAPRRLALADGADWLRRGLGG